MGGVQELLFPIDGSDAALTPPHFWFISTNKSSKEGPVTLHSREIIKMVQEAGGICMNSFADYGNAHSSSSCHKREVKPRGFKTCLSRVPHFQDLLVNI